MLEEMVGDKQTAAEPRRWLVSGNTARSTHLILAHGAGLGMESPVLDRMSRLIEARGVTVHRFEFPYMAARSLGLSRRPAPRAETLTDDYRRAIAEVRAKIGPRAQIFAGGKSMGGRIACLAANREPDVAGVVVLGFPLLPPRKPASSRAGVIEGLTRAALIVQGTRDAFGGVEAFAGLTLPDWIKIHWIEDGDHDLKPRKSSGATQDDGLASAADAVAQFCKRGG